MKTLFTYRMCSCDIQIVTEKPNWKRMEETMNNAAHEYDIVVKESAC